MLYLIKFEDGLANGKELIVSRIPKYLRIAYDKMGRMRAMADKDSKASKYDDIYYYVLYKKVGKAHIYRWPNRAQPCMIWMRSNTEWRSFVEREEERNALNNPVYDKE